METGKTKTQIAVENRAARLGMTVKEMFEADQKFIDTMEWCGAKEGPTDSDFKDRGKTFRHVMECTACQTLVLNAPQPALTKRWPDHPEYDFRLNGHFTAAVVRHPRTHEMLKHIIGCKLCQTTLAVHSS